MTIINGGKGGGGSPGSRNLYYVIYGRPLNCARCMSSGSAIGDVIIGSSSHFDLKGMLFLSKQKVGDRMEVGFGPKTRGHLFAWTLCLFPCNG